MCPIVNFDVRQTIVYDNSDAVGISIRPPWDDAYCELLSKFVKKDGAVAGRFEKTLLISHSAGERSSDIPEEFRLNQRFRQCGTVDC
jgi:hypothetical protein